MTSSINKIHRFHIDRAEYFLSEENTPTQGSPKLETGEKLLRLAKDSIDEKEKKLLQGCAFDYLNGLKKSGETGEEFENLFAEAFLILIGKPDSEVEDIKEAIASNSDWYQFIINNRIHYMVHRQDFTLTPEEINNQVCVDGEWFDLTQLDKEETEKGFTFYPKDSKDPLFTTDSSLKLTDHFWAGFKGVIKGNAMKVYSFNDFFHVPASGKYWVTVYSVAKDLTDYSFGDSHGYLGLEEADGKVIYAGQYGVEDDLGYSDILQPFGPKKMGLEVPDRYTSVPLAQNQVNEVKIEITKEQYNTLYESIQKDNEKGIDGSLIRGNCTAYVRKKLKLINIQAKTSITAHRFLLSYAIKIFPKPLQRRLITWVKKTPSWVKTIFVFLPIIHIPMIAIIAWAKLCSAGKDITLVNAIFRPWKLDVDHPVALFEWIDQCREEEKNHIILQNNVKSESAIGGLISKTTQDLGYTEESQSRIEIAKTMHITQHKHRSYPLMIVYVLYKAIAFKIKNWLSSQQIINNQTMLLYLHSLKNQRFITPYQFTKLRDTIGQKEHFLYEVSLIIKKNHQNGLIDRRSFIHLKELLNNKETQPVLNYLIMLSLLNNINTVKHHNTLEHLVTPEMQLQIEEIFSKYNKDFHFSADSIHFFQQLCARINCYEWAEKISDEDTKQLLIEAVNEIDGSKFSLTLNKYYTTIKENKNTLPYEKAIIEEMIESTTYPVGDDSFINFSHIMQTQKVISDLEDNLNKLHDQIEAEDDSINEETINDLKQLHQNIGVSLGCDSCYTGSATFFSLHSGTLRQKWEQIESLLNRRIIPTASENDTWPDIGLREIKPAASVQETETVQSDKKKVLITYCSWGNGHRSATDALQKYLGTDYRSATCDIPDEILIERDPLFNLLGKKHSITTLYNTLVSGDCWGVLRLLKKIGGGSTPEEELKIQKDLIRRKLLQERPDVVVATYEKHAKITYEVASELGIPFILVITDMVYEIAAWDTIPNDPMLKVLLPYDIEAMRNKLIGKVKADEQVDFIGFPIRPKFLEPMDKEKLKEKYNIKDDEKVIICMNGGVGGDVPWPKLIADSKTGTLGKCRLFVICGNNAEFKKKVSHLHPKDPDVTIEALGFVNEETMAELSEISDIAVTKPGGSQTAELLFKRTFMLLDTRFSKQLPWELDTANTLIQNGCATEIDPSQFIESLKNAFEKTPASIPELNGDSIDPKEGFLNSVDTMISIGEIQTKKHSLYPEFDPIEDSEKIVDQQIAKFLHHAETLYPKKVFPSLDLVLWGIKNNPGQYKYLRFNLQTSRFESSKKFLPRDIKYAVSLMKRKIRTGEEVDPESVKNLIRMLTHAQEKHKKFINPLMDQLIEIDRYRVAKQMHNEMTLEEAEALYLVPGAKKQLQKWVGLKTSNGRSNKNRESDDFFMLPENEAISVFLQRPEEVDFVKNLHLHRLASTFEHKFTVREGHLYIRSDGNETSVTDLIGKFKYVNDRIISTDDQREYTYTYDQGLTPITDGQHPLHWEGEIPLFKQKDRKTKDYRLEVISAIGKENHGWTRLKDPEGNIYSFGRIWDPDYQLEKIQRAKTIPGLVKGAGDIQEFLGLEEDWKKTKIQIDQTTFDHLKATIIKIQREDKTYNLINNNCVSTVDKLLQELGIDLRTNSSATAFFIPIPGTIKKFFYRHQTIYKITSFITYPMTLLRNLGLAAVGMFNQEIDERFTRGGLRQVWKVIDPQSTMIDHPSQLRTVQEILEEDSQDFTEDGKISWKRFSKSHMNYLNQAQIQRVGRVSEITNTVD